MPKITVKLPRNLQTGSRSTAAEEGPIESGIVFINTTGEEIPAYGVFQGHDTRNQQYLPAVVIAKKPIDGTANASAIFVNGPFAVPDKDFGFAQNGPLYQVLTDGTATAGETLGLTAGSFEASPGSGPFIAIGSDDVRDDIFLCLLQAGSGSAKYFVLAEDAGSLPVLAYPGEMDDGTGVITPVADAEPVELFYWLSVLDTPKLARAGYAGIYARDDAGRQVFVNGPCIVGCTTTASIDPGTPPAGEVDAVYTHTVTVSGLDVGGVSASNLPPGLSINPTTGAITGTPTVAGTYLVTFTGGSSDTPSCPITRIAKIIIAEAA